MPHDQSLYQELQLADEKDQIGYARHLCELYLKNHPDHVPTLICYACNLISLAQFSAAKAALDRAEAIVPHERLDLILAQRGHLLAAQGDFNGAAEIFMQGHKLKSNDATYLIFAASIAFRRGDIPGAQVLARQATECSEGCLDEAWFNLGGYLLSDRQYRDAADCYRKALKIDPNYQIARDRLNDVELILQNEG